MLFILKLYLCYWFLNYIYFILKNFLHWQMDRKLIYSHLTHKYSDQRYQPLRQAVYQFQTGSINKPKQNKQDFYQSIKRSSIPQNVQYLSQDLDKPIPIRNFQIISQNQRRFQPIPQVLAVKLAQNARNETIIYRFGNYEVSRPAYKSVHMQKRPQNEYNSKKQLKKVQYLQKSGPKYNLMSIIDEPLNYLFSNISSCSKPCNNQLYADRSQLILHQFPHKKR